MSDKAMVHSGLSASIPVEGGAGRFAELIARLEAAEVADERLGLDVVEACGGKLTGQHTRGKMQWRVIWGTQNVAFRNPARSLDAALALAERVLVGDEYDAVDALSRALIALASFGFRADKPIGPQLALAVCITILKALEAKQ